MSHEIVLDESIEVPRALQETFAYVADFSRIEQWDPGVRSATTLSAGPPGVGSEYRVDMKAGFSLHYTVLEFTPLTAGVVYSSNITYRDVNLTNSSTHIVGGLVEPFVFANNASAAAGIPQGAHR